MGKKGLFKIITILLSFVLITGSYADAVVLSNSEEKISVSDQYSNGFGEGVELANFDEATKVEDIKITSSPKSEKGYIVGEKIILEVDPPNGDTQIQEIRLTFLPEDESYVSSININLKYDDNNKKYIGVYEVTSGTVISGYRCSEAYVQYESSMKYITLTNELFFSVTYPKDNSTPVLKSVKVDKHNVKPGDTVNFEIDIEDESPIVSIDIDFALVSTWLVDEFKDIELTYDEVKDKYIGSFQITESMYSGQYNVCTLKATDQYQNQMKLMNSENRYSIYLNEQVFSDESAFEVSGTESIHITPPIIKDYKVSNPRPNIDSEVVISVDAYDEECEIEYVMFTYEVLKGNDKKIIDMMLEYNPITKLYEKKLYINKFFPYNGLKLNEIEVANNNKIDDIPRNTFISDRSLLRKCDISIGRYSLEDSKPPVGKVIGIDKKYAFIGDKVKISVEASDAESGIASIIMGTNEGGPFFIKKHKELYYNPKTKLYETELTISDHKGFDLTMGYDEWRFWWVDITDYWGNSSSVNLSDFSNLSVFSDDINTDGKCDILDLSIVAKQYNTNSSDKSWKSEYDFNCDEILDIYDLVILSKRI